jgi:hypothetical protein
MNARVIALMSKQHGLVTRPQALRAGMAADQIDRLVRTKRWTVVRRGVYAETEFVATLHTVRERRMLADRAASMRIGSQHVMSHHSSAYPLDLDVLHERPAATHVTRLGIVGSHNRHGINHHRAPYSTDLLTEREGLVCLNGARTAADIGRAHGYRHCLVAGDSALRTGTTQAELDAVAEAMANWPFATVVRDAFASTSPDTDSIGETLSRELITELGHGVPEVQFGLTAEGRTAWCDLRLGRHIFEFDGRVKYQRVDEGGFASDSPDEVVWFEKGRQDFVCGFKLGMSRLIWHDVFGSARERTKERLVREYLETCNRFGTDISDLTTYRPRGPRPRPRRRLVLPSSYAA